jgi:hypothetical protein
MNADVFFCSLAQLRIADLIRSAQRAICYAGPGIQLDLESSVRTFKSRGRRSTYFTN